MKRAAGTPLADEPDAKQRKVDPIPDLTPDTKRKTKEEIEAWLKVEDCSDMWEQIKGRSVDTIYSYSKKELKEAFGVLKGAGFYNWLHPEPPAHAKTQGTFKPNPFVEQFLFKPTCRESFGVLFKENVADIKNLELDLPPKHFSNIHPLVITQQMKDLRNKAFAFQDSAKLSPNLEERNIILSGPMGVGKSYMLWFLAASAYAQGRKLIYISDCSNWMKFNDQKLLYYLIANFLSLNSDLLTQEEFKSLHATEVDYETLEVILKRDPPIIIFDEHIEFVVKCEEFQKPSSTTRMPPWMLQFLKLNAHHRFMTVVLGASSHARFELKYLKNGWQEQIRFVQSVEREEAKQILNGLGFDFLKLEKISPESIIDECNCIPRELRTFVGTWNYHDTAAEEEVIEIFKKQRENDFFTELEIFYSKLTPEHQNFFIQETLHKMFKSGTMNAEASVIEGFIDLSLCLRTRYDIRPMTRAASAALFKLFVNYYPHLPKIASLIPKLSNGTLSGDDFEDLIWALILRDSFQPGGLTITPYYLNGNAAPQITLKYSDFLVLKFKESTDFPLALQNQPVLVRCLENHPRWDFMSLQACFQISISEFTEHNKKSKNISKSFTANSELEKALIGMTGRKATARITDGAFDIKFEGLNPPTAPIFFYVTLKKPHHPIKYNNYKQLRVIAAQEIWAPAK